MKLQPLPGSSLPQLQGPDHGKGLELLEVMQRRPQGGLTAAEQDLEGPGEGWGQSVQQSLWSKEKGAWMEIGGAQFSFDLRKMFFSHKGG